jgi:hypothetical protein
VNNFPKERGEAMIRDEFGFVIDFDDDVNSVADWADKYLVIPYLLMNSENE